MALAIFASFDPAPGREAEVEAILRGMVAPSRGEPGCRRYDLYRVQGDDMRFRIVEVYDDQAAVEHHRGSSHYKIYRAQIGELLQTPIKVEFSDLVDTSA